MKCANCGAENPNQGMKFCTMCGQPLHRSTGQQIPYGAAVNAPQPKPKQKNTTTILIAILITIILLIAVIGVILIVQSTQTTPEANAPTSSIEALPTFPPAPETPADTTNYSLYMGLDWIDVSNINTTGVYDLGGYIFNVESVSGTTISYRLREFSAGDSSPVEIVGTCEMSFGSGTCSYTDVQNRYRGTLQFTFGADQGITISDSRDGYGQNTISLYAAGSPMGYNGYLKHRQRVLVYTYGSSAQVSFEQWENGNWVVKHIASGTVGANGITPPQWRQEGSKTTPEGTFDLGFAFAVDYLDTGLDYKQVRRGTYWVDDANSAYYNTWQTREANGDWRHAESLYTTFTSGSARSSIVIEFNGDGLSTAGVTRGSGSAIFFSGRVGTLKGTNGDVFISQSDMLQILPYLDKEDDPVIQIHAQ